MATRVVRAGLCLFGVRLFLSNGFFAKACVYGESAVGLKEIELLRSSASE